MESFKIKNKHVCFCIALVLLLIITFGIKIFNSYYDNMSIKEIEKNTIILKNNKGTSNNGQLVLLKGKLKNSNDILTDDLFNISVESSRLYRNIEVYQWIEYEEKNKDGKKVYKYKKGWFDKKIDSDDFKKTTKVNPKKFKYKSKYINQNQITVGNFELSKSQIKMIPCNVRLKLGSYNTIIDGFIIYDNYFINSKDPENPEIGDYRISYYYNNWSDVTILALQQNESFEDYITKKGDKINFITSGKLNLSQVKEIIYNELKK